MQLVFPWSIAKPFNAEELLVSEANSEIVARIEAWPNWGQGLLSRVLLVTGPKASGKTVHGLYWRHISQAQLVQGKDLATYLSSQPISHWPLEDNHIFLDDVDLLLEWPELLFSLLNRYYYAGNNYLLLTSTFPQSILANKLGLPDLSTRIKSLPSLAIQEIDDQMFDMLLPKLLADLQLHLQPEVINFIKLRVGRSYSDLHNLVDRLDAYSKHHKVKLTIPVVRGLL